MTIFHLLHVMGRLNAAIDSGKYPHIAVSDICRHIEQGNLVSFLEVRLFPAGCFSLFEICPDYEVVFLARLQQALRAAQTSRQPRLGVEHSGLAFLNALILRIIEEHELEKVDFDPSLAEPILAVR